MCFLSVEEERIRFEVQIRDWHIMSYVSLARYKQPFITGVVTSKATPQDEEP